MKPILRIAGFLLGLAMLVVIANTFFIQTDTLSFLTLHEITHRKDVEIAFVGSSVARNHFDPALVTEATSLSAFNLALPYMSLQGSRASLKLMFSHNQPKYTVLVAEPYWFTATRESPQTQFRLIPFIKNPLDRLDYYVDLCMQDERWLDRLLLPRMFGPENVQQLTKTLDIHLNPERYLQEQRDAALKDPSATYQGSGYMHPGFGIPENERLRIAAYNGQDTDVRALPAYSQKALLRIKALCEKNGSALMILIFPYMTGTMLAEPDYLAYNALLRDFAAQHNIPCFDFTLAKETLLPTLDPFFQNTEHMSVEGTAALTQAFCEVFSRYTAGEDPTQLFYADTGEYLASITRVTNVWLEKDDASGAFTALSHHGTHVAPEYRFAFVSADGETLLGDFAPENSWQGDVPQGHTLRVYARAQNSTQPPVYFDWQ